MIFQEHLELKDKHAFLGASKYHWVNYDEEKLIETYLSHIAKIKGTELHAYAEQAIRLHRKQKGNDTLSMYINDGIGFKMIPEQILYYSEFCFGTADTINFSEKKGLLRIHDLKTGITPAKMDQLYVYDALFCLEYDVRPGDIEFVNRIYQCNEIIEDLPTVEIIGPIMDKIINFDKIIRDINEKEL